MRIKTIGLAAFAAALCACAVPGIRHADIDRPTVRASWQHAGIVDLRRDFAGLFCEELARHPPTHGPVRPCAAWLYGGIPGTGPLPSPPLALPATRTLIVIPGILGECVDDWVTPFSADHAALRELGYRVHVMPVTGRGSSEQNAAILLAQFAALELDGAVVVAYSKGLTDFMVAAATPEAAAWRNGLQAVISVAGVAGGTPIADHAQEIYTALLKKKPFKTCAAADGGGVDSLTHRRALAFQDAFRAAAPGIPVYSLAAVSSPGQANLVLERGYDALSRIDQRNDGQVLVEDAILPGSHLLAIVNADHWSIALPFEDSDEPLMAPLSIRNSFPRRALILAALRVAAPVASNAAQAAPR